MTVTFKSYEVRFRVRLSDCLGRFIAWVERSDGLPKEEPTLLDARLTMLKWQRTFGRRLRCEVVPIIHW